MSQLIELFFGRLRECCIDCIARAAKLCRTDYSAASAASGEEVTVGRVEGEDCIFDGRSARNVTLSDTRGRDGHIGCGRVLETRTPSGGLRSDRVRSGTVVASGGELYRLTGKARNGIGGADGNGLELTGS